MWGWFRKGARKDEEGDKDEGVKNVGNGTEKSEYLEDLKPKFEDNLEEKKKLRQEQLQGVIGEQNRFQLAWSTVKFNDILQIHTIPCFGRAIGVGGAIAGVTFGVMKFMRKGESRNKILNWTMLGFFLGSVVSWEQCRYQLRQQQKVANNKVVKRQDSN
jgi:hypothetical protein